MARRKQYPTDVTDEEWSFAAPYLALINEKAAQRQHDLREVFNALRWMARAGAPWRMLPGDFPPWEAVYQQTRRWLQAGCFEAMANDLRSVIRGVQGRQGLPSATVLDGRILAIELRERPACGLRWLQAAQRLEGAHGRRYAGTPAGRACHASQ